MHLLVTGGGKAGSWIIRGEQLGKAIGATVNPHALDVGAFDAAVLVKRPRPDMLARLHVAGTPIVWDVLDAFPQPTSDEWSKAQAMTWLREQVARIRPVALVAATRAMHDDCAEFGLPVLWLPHHARPGIKANPIRERIERVGYEGGPYLGHWQAKAQKACARRGWEFIVNPPDLADLDVVLAVREARCYPARLWKSNVKLANAQGSGTPCILNSDAGYMETACGAECWADTEEGLNAALDSLEPASVRRHASGELLAAAPLLPGIAKTYAAWLSKLSF